MEMSLICCRPGCGVLLGFVRENGLHVKYKDLRLVSQGVTQIICRKCGSINEWKPLPAPNRGLRG